MKCFAAEHGQIGGRGARRFGLWRCRASAAQEHDVGLTARIGWTGAGAKRVALALFGCVWLAISAHAGSIALASLQMPKPAPAAAANRGYEAEDHFPGAQLIYASDPAAVDANAAPAAGVTGTAPLPAMPVPRDAVLPPAGDGTVIPARPFALGRASAIDRGRALECLTAAIYYEAATEPDAGQQAVAQVILNRVRHPAFPNTVCGVVYQGSERATGCQFSFACDGAMARVPSRAYWLRAMRVAAAALAGRVFAPVGLATHYHTYAVTPAWNRSLVMTAAIGAHFFHRWQGWWGTPAAFSQVYAGHEPVPGPHPRAATALPALQYASTSSLSAAAPAVPATPVSAIQPAYRATSVAVQPAAAQDSLPPSSQILDRWKDSGQPLR
jgi:spore germination cell wall hydrolase CwlJ-like protein